MPFMHVGVFAVGAAIGAATALAITRRQQAAVAIPVTRPSTTTLTAVTGSLDVIAPPQASGSGVLKYGNPGEFGYLLFVFSFFELFTQGPIADLLARKAYVAGYDRRLRHPAWVS